MFEDKTVWSGVELMHVRMKRYRGEPVYQLVEDYRDARGVRQRVVANLGDYPTVEEAMKDLPERIDALYRIAATCREAAEIVRAVMPSALMPDGVVPRPNSSGSREMNRLLWEYWTQIRFAERAERALAQLEPRLTHLMLVVKAVRDPQDGHSRSDPCAPCEPLLVTAANDRKR